MSDNDKSGPPQGLGHPRIIHKYEVVLYDGGRLEIRSFPTDEMMAIWMHEKARQIMEAYFKKMAQQNQERVVLAHNLPGVPPA